MAFKNCCKQHCMLIVPDFRRSCIALIALAAHAVRRLMKLKFMNVMKFSLAGKKKKSAFSLKKMAMLHR